jgi:hypothetical protein
VLLLAAGCGDDPSTSDDAGETAADTGGAATGDPTGTGGAETPLLSDGERLVRISTALRGKRPSEA